MSPELAGILTAIALAVIVFIVAMDPRGPGNP